MSLKKLADNDELGNPVAHFFKSGNVLRSKSNDKLTPLISLLPKSGMNGTKVEYDIWYDFPSDNRIHGYVYTDVLTEFLYLRVASSVWATKAMQKAAEVKISDEGERLFSILANNCGDKYRLRSRSLNHEFVVFLAGTNILNKVTDWEKIDNAVRQGAKLKCHPLTSASAYQHLVHKYGDAVIDKKVSGHQLLDNAEIVGCCDNSEMGIAAMAKGKTVYRFGKEDQWCTYSAIYRALMHKGHLNSDRLKAILSCKVSGLIPASDPNANKRIDGFFAQYAKEDHIAPKNFSGRVQQADRTNS
tara:strand:+ start:202 stop:1104 length:903 start_codon:yes stop_codon:yes gene_type:complete